MLPILKWLNKLYYSKELLCCMLSNKIWWKALILNFMPFLKSLSNKFNIQFTHLKMIFIEWALTTLFLDGVANPHKNNASWMLSHSMFVLGIQLSSGHHIIKQTAMHTLLFKKTLCISLKKSFCKWFQLYQQSHLTHSILHALKIKSGLKLRLFKLLTLMNTIQVYRIKV